LVIPEMNDSDSATESSSVGKKCSLVVGVNGSKSLPSLPRLEHAEDDARKIDLRLHDEVCGFILSSKVLSGELATIQNVKDSVARLIRENEAGATGNLLLFYFVGHGYPVETSTGDIEIFLVTDDFNRDTAIYQSDHC